MTSTKKKGQKKENLAKKELEAEGFWVVFKSYTLKLGPIYKGIDFADLFDLVAVKSITIPFKDGDGTKTDIMWRFVSCKHASKGHDQHRQAIREFAEKYGPYGTSSFELWIWYKPGYHGRGRKRCFVKAHWLKQIMQPTEKMITLRTP